jgi:hypothetical protein
LNCDWLGGIQDCGLLEGLSYPQMEVRYEKEIQVALMEEEGRADTSPGDA